MKYISQYETYDNVQLIASRYINGGGIALMLYTEDGEAICDLSVNLNPPLAENLMAVDHDFSDEHMAFIEENQIGRWIGSRSQGYAIFQIVELNIERLKELVTTGKEYLDLAG